MQSSYQLEQKNNSPRRSIFVHYIEEGSNLIFSFRRKEVVKSNKGIGNVKCIALSLFIVLKTILLATYFYFIFLKDGTDAFFGGLQAHAPFVDLAPSFSRQTVFK